MLDLYQLRTFHQAMTHKSFTRAARELRLTQSSVSQQIAKLESQVGGKLFQRLGHEIVPTPLAQELNRLAVLLLEQVREFEERQQKTQSSPEGLVRYSMPESCQWTPHFKDVMSRLTAFPGVRAEVSILTNAGFASALLEGRVDFGFIVGEKPRPEFAYEKFSDERYSAVAARRELLAPLGASARAPLRLIAYPGSAFYLSVWSRGGGLSRTAQEAAREPVLEIGTLAGAINAVKSGTGIAVIPTHCVADELKARELVEWPHPAAAGAASPIYIVRRRGERLPHRVELVIELLKRSKAEIG